MFPPPFDRLKERYEDDFRYALARPSSNRADLVKDLRWYFKQRQANELEGTPIQDEESYYELKDCLRATHFQVLYRRWLTKGEAALEVVSSQVAADAIERCRTRGMPRPAVLISSSLTLGWRGSSEIRGGRGG